MDYQEKKQLEEKYYSQVLNGMSFSALEAALEAELKYSKQVNEVLRSIKQSLRENHLEIYMTALEEGMPISSEMQRLDESVVDYLEEIAKEKITQRNIAKLKKLVAMGISKEEIIAQLYHPTFFTKEEINAELEAQSQKERAEVAGDWFGFRGKMDRMMFGKRLLMAVAFGLVIFRIATLSRDRTVLIGALVIAGIPLLVFLLSQMVRRLRDMGVPSWSLLIVIVLTIAKPIVGLLALVAMLVVKTIK